MFHIICTENNQLGFFVILTDMVEVCRQLFSGNRLTVEKIRFRVLINLQKCKIADRGTLCRRFPANGQEKSSAEYLL